MQLSPFDSLDVTVPIVAGVGGALLCFSLYTAQKNKNTKCAAPSTAPLQRVHALERCGVLLGDILEFARNAQRVHDWVAETSVRFNGEPWRINLPGIKNILILTTPELVEEVMVTQFDTFEHGEPLNEAALDLFGRSVVTTDGEAWYQLRKAAAKFFTAGSLRSCMTTQIRQNLAQVYDVMDRNIAAGASIDLLKLFHEFALQTFAEIGLGVDLNLIGTDEQHPMDHAIEDVTPVILRRAGLPVFYWKLERWLKIGPEAKVADAMKPVRTWLHSVVKASLAAAHKKQRDRVHSSLDPTENSVRNIVELFLKQNPDNKDGPQAEGLVDFIFTFILGARSTSAAALAWIFLLLAKHPRVEQKIRDEMTVMLSGLDDDAYVVKDHIQKLVYLEATIKEVLRLYPTIPLNQRSANKDTTLGGSIPVKKGSTVVVYPYATARLPSVWGPDAAEFKPERWIDPKTGKLIIVSSNKFSTFGAGPRICVGMKLAMLELRVVTANLLRRYRFELAEPNDCSYVVSMELLPANPVIVTATRLTAAN